MKIFRQKKKAGFLHQSKKFNVFCEMLYSFTRNTYSIYSGVAGEHHSSKRAFQIQLVEELFKKYCPRVKILSSFSSSEASLPTINVSQSTPQRIDDASYLHTPVNISSEDSNSRPQVCWLESAMNYHHKVTNHMCLECNVALCLQCFSYFHQLNGIIS